MICVCFGVFLCIVSSLSCEFGCHCQCSWLPGKTWLWSELLYIKLVAGWTLLTRALTDWQVAFDDEYYCVVSCFDWSNCAIGLFTIDHTVLYMHCINNSIWWNFVVDFSCHSCVVTCWLWKYHHKSEFNPLKDRGVNWLHFPIQV